MLCVRSVFDTISYAKGCCVIRMLEVFLGSEDFRRGLVQYMKQFEYGNALTDDLWAVLSKVSGKDVEKMMTAWTKEVSTETLNRRAKIFCTPHAVSD